VSAVGEVHDEEFYTKDGVEWRLDVDNLRGTNLEE
jgi:hypothetical protein